jgi:site-specific DNA-methyltransferase (adenine-specific)
MDYMASIPDKWFDLAIVDPPYGGGRHHQRNKQIAKTKGYSYDTAERVDKWDKAPSDNYFIQLFRIADKIILWGGNYFDLPPQRNFIIYYKTNIPEGFDMAVCEYAWTNIPGNSRIFLWHNPPDPNRFHPTQKPIALYKWLLSRYAKPGWNIIDTHMGSGSIAIACHDLGYDLTACELDKDYYEAAMKRIKIHQAQGVLEFA